MNIRNTTLITLILLTTAIPVQAGSSFWGWFTSPKPEAMFNTKFQNWAKTAEHVCEGVPLTNDLRNHWRKQTGLVLPQPLNWKAMALKQDQLEHAA